MIERKFVSGNLKEYAIEEYLRKVIGKAGLSYIKMQRTPLGEKILICSSRPGIIVGKAGANISKLTKDLKELFGLDNPQIELLEAENPMNDANIVAESIANSLERFGTSRFKGVGHKAMSEIMRAGARGVEILISGKVPSSRAKTWRFYMGYLKKSGDLAISGVHTAYSVAKLKTGIVGIQVRIMPSTTKLPDDIERISAEEQAANVAKLENVETGETETLKKEKEKKKPARRRKTVKKTDAKKTVKKRAARKKKTAKQDTKQNQQKTEDKSEGKSEEKTEEKTKKKEEAKEAKE